MHPWPALIFLAGLLTSAAEGIGVNWGTQTTHPLPPKIVVQLLKDNGFDKVKLFDADQSTMSALAGSGIEVMIAIPNNMLDAMTSFDTAKQWVKRNVTRYLFTGGVDIKYVAVGNEPFLESYNNSFLNVTFPALQNIQNAINHAGYGEKIKATVPLNADVYDTPKDSSMPSAGRFRADISDQMASIVQFLADNSAPFTVNIYPYLSLYLDENFPVNFAFFDGGGDSIVDNGIQYTNVFDANFDTLIAALKTVGHGDMPIFIGEVGWPTDGDKNANFGYAQRFYAGLLKRIADKQGTPLRPTLPEVYLFGLIDEDAKSIAPGSFERHWGIFTYDGQPKFPMDLSGHGQNSFLVPAKNVEYLSQQWCVVNPDAMNLSNLDANFHFACAYSDCTALGYGSSCNGMDEVGNASYAFNMYFQAQNQGEGSCVFQGLAAITTQNVSKDSCNFIVEIKTDSASSSHHLSPSFLPMLAMPLVVILVHLM